MQSCPVHQRSTTSLLIASFDSVRRCTSESISQFKLIYRSKRHQRGFDYFDSNLKWSRVQIGMSLALEAACVSKTDCIYLFHSFIFGLQIWRSCSVVIRLHDCDVWVLHALNVWKCLGKFRYIVSTAVNNNDSLIEENKIRNELLRLILKLWSSKEIKYFVQS
jgi:hypothetical protein